MVPVCGKPILEHQVTWLKAGGVTDVVFLGGYQWEAIKDHFGDGKDFGINAHYSVEDSPLGRGGAIKAGFPMIPDTENTVAVLNGDVLTAETLANISAQHQERKAANESHLATIMVVPMVEKQTREESVPLPENQREEPEGKKTRPVQHVPATTPLIVQ